MSVKISASKILFLDFTPSPIVQAVAIFCSVIMIAFGSIILVTNIANKSKNGSVIAAFFVVLGLIILIGNFYPRPSHELQINVSNGIVRSALSDDQIQIDPTQPADIKIHYLEGGAYSGPFGNSGWHGYIRDVAGQYMDLFKVGTNQQASYLLNIIQDFINSHGNNI